jgi:tryptophanyl-tRNA synthetase
LTFYQWLTFFLEEDEELERIRRAYASGTMLTGEIKKELIKTLTPMVEAHQRARALVTDDVVKTFMQPRDIPFT